MKPIRMRQRIYRGPHLCKGMLDHSKSTPSFAQQTRHIQAAKRQVSNFALKLIKKKIKKLYPHSAIRQRGQLSMTWHECSQPAKHAPKHNSHCIWSSNRCRIRRSVYLAGPKVSTTNTWKKSRQRRPENVETTTEKSRLRICISASMASAGIFHHEL